MVFNLKVTDAEAGFLIWLLLDKRAILKTTNSHIVLEDGSVFDDRAAEDLADSISRQTRAHFYPLTARVLCNECRLNLQEIEVSTVQELREKRGGFYCEDCALDIPF